ncbi:acyl-CoA/acyl-ACP dehydrogenase [Streptomyces sp. NBC_01387]|uniref:acyl-CoA dehydrogenase family protein n=1 Tax=unclassified Streptomyces TaxID=2593676 RepID=UPI002253CE49|nr:MULTISPECIES: acyl-CoA dehydrogenase family protein [unclassified Streptomyces]MCX4550200.1 acyl-CoA/acyl-ACP dehydrogenase [Streptomyces sp. NBC_01500]WSC21698.1 acyl-CoA/acyl-ACP dehydrogenase [Streptomyces sp. NBC_01766]WSV55655.1 acyl-CoA/acyl-ACP dehydrogenase [Streptomyces sp. NBC_01014]
MDFRLTDDQLALRNGFRELLAGRFDREALRAAVDRGTLDRALWRELGDAGLFSLRLPEARGGVGLGLPEAVLVFEEAGRALLPGPLVATHLAAGAVPGADTGEAVVTASDGALVEWLAEADDVLGQDLAQDARPIRSVDPLTPLHRVGGERTAGPDVVLPPGTNVVTLTLPPDATALTAALLTAALQLGSAARTTELAVQHARQREQFGQPIGAFQAVKHLCAQMLVRTEIARAAVYAAAVTAEAAADEADVTGACVPDAYEAAGAKLLADDAAVRNARDCLQVHGGMGFTWEADVHLHLKRAWVRAGQWITAAEAEELVASRL